MKIQAKKKCTNCGMVSLGHVQQCGRCKCEEFQQYVPALGMYGPAPLADEFDTNDKDDAYAAEENDD